MTKKKQKDPVAGLIPEGDIRQSAQSIAAWLLEQPATKKVKNKDGTGGEREVPFTYRGREMTNLGVLLLGMMRTAQDNPQAAMTMFTLGGVLRDRNAPPSPQELKRAEEAAAKRKREVATAERTIRTQLEKAGVWSTGLQTLVTAVATARVQLNHIADRAYQMEPFVVEVSREGAERVKSNPVVGDFMRYTQQLTTLSSQLVHRAIQLSGKQDSRAEEDLVKALRDINDLSKFEK